MCQDASHVSPPFFPGNINVWVSDQLFEAFEQSRLKSRRTVKAQLEVILEDYLAREGLWPPEGQQEQGQ
jgi:hypothetical protein